MTLASTGSISLGGRNSLRSVNIELGRNPTAALSINDSDIRTMTGIPSGQISFADLYGDSYVNTSVSTGWATNFTARSALIDPTTTTSVITATFRAIARDSSTGRLIAVGDSKGGSVEAVYYSTDDGATWSRSTTNFSVNFASCSAIAYSPTLSRWIIGAASSNAIYSSSDGVTWTYQTTASQIIRAMIWDTQNSQFVLVGNAGLILRSSTGLGTWTTCSSNTTENIFAVVQWGSILAAGGANGRLLTSTDSGSTWSSSTPLGTGIGTVQCLATNGTYLVGATSINTLIYRSDPGSGWVSGGNLTSASSLTGSTFSWQSMTYSSTLSKFIVVGTSGGLVLSSNSNGTAWDPLLDYSPLSRFTTLRGIIWTGSYFIAVGDNNLAEAIIAKSTDGINWILWSNTERHRSVAVNSTRYVTGNSYSGLKYSSDGINWLSSKINANAIRSSPSAVPYNMNVLGTNGSYFIAVGNVFSSPTRYFLVLKSQDNTGAVFEPVLQTTGALFDSIAWSPTLSLWVLVGYDGTNGVIRTSPDGVNWTTRTNPISGGSGLSAVDWDSKRNKFIALSRHPGTNNLPFAFLIESSDGITWSTITTTTISGATTAFEGVSMKITPAGSYIACSSGSTGFRSTDGGITWNSCTFTGATLAPLAIKPISVWGSRVLIGTGGGTNNEGFEVLFISHDDGQTFNYATTNVIGSFIYAVSADTSNGRKPVIASGYFSLANSIGSLATSG